MEPTPCHGATPPPPPPAPTSGPPAVRPAPPCAGLARPGLRPPVPPLAPLRLLALGHFHGGEKRRLLTSGYFSSSPLVAPESALRCSPSPAVAPIEHIHGVAASRCRPAAAPSRWPFARRPPSARRPKVDHGLSRDNKFLRLAFQDWIEAIDPRHRYGHNLHFYYDVWCQSQTGQPFFYWLDIGEGKDVDLPECPRALLKKQCIKYLDLIITRFNDQ